MSRWFGGKPSSRSSNQPARSANDTPTPTASSHPSPSQVKVPRLDVPNASDRRLAQAIGSGDGTTSKPARNGLSMPFDDAVYSDLGEDSCLDSPLSEAVVIAIPGRPRQGKNTSAQRPGSDETKSRSSAEVRLQSLLDERSRTIRAMEKDKAALEKEVEEISAALQGQENQVGSYKEENRSLKSKLQDFQALHRTHQETQTGLETKVNALTEHLNSAQTKYRHSRGEAERLAGLLKDLKDRYEKDISEAQKRTADIVREKANLQSTFDILKAEQAARFQKGITSSGSPRSISSSEEETEEEDSSDDSDDEDHYMTSVEGLDPTLIAKPSKGAPSGSSNQVVSGRGGNVGRRGTITSGAGLGRADNTRVRGKEYRQTGAQTDFERVKRSSRAVQMDSPDLYKVERDQLQRQLDTLWTTHELHLTSQAGSDRYKMERDRLREQLDTLKANQPRSGRCKRDCERIQGQLDALRATHDSHLAVCTTKIGECEAESARLQDQLNRFQDKHETHVAQARRHAADLMRDKVELQSALERMKMDGVASSRLQPPPNTREKVRRPRSMGGDMRYHDPFIASSSAPSMNHPFNSPHYSGRLSPPPESQPVPNNSRNRHAPSPHRPTSGGEWEQEDQIDTMHPDYGTPSPRPMPSGPVVNVYLDTTNQAAYHSAASMPSLAPQPRPQASQPSPSFWPQAHSFHLEKFVYNEGPRKRTPPP
ncbi:hypothetical protein DFP72DRAFT_888447 [Ephemerocybe angulata]|uniref:Uncharacterized protein n=1 Tax=Ephemerocybe angulata TaxID=980116 RepID=A0A8H6I3H9_9AGAR|nr:hypothetical protein DFP72DRAFT_888447 [Tulosesus angulatus]